jgi:hypothetical protein
MIMRVISLRLAFAAIALWFVAMPAQAAVFLNGVNIDGLTNQKIDGVTVVIDGKGDVYLTAANIKVQQVDVAPATKPVVSPPAAPPSPPSPPAAAPATTAAVATPTGLAPTKRYYLAAEHNGPGMAQYDIDVFINSVWVRRLLHSEGQVVLEITAQLKQGKNVVHFSAQKRVVGERKSSSPLHTMTVHVGEGHGTGGQVTIDDVQVEYARTAAELQNFEDDRTLVVR